MINLIGISGRIGHGKDTVAGIINELTKNIYQIKRFSGKLKQMASLLTGIDAEDFNRQEIKKQYLGEEWGMTIRELLQKLGTDAVRNGLHENAWVNALFADYEPGNRWIVPDVRFPNEYMAIKKRNGIIIRVERGPKPLNEHPSETALDVFSFDYTIHNNGSIMQLQTEVFKTVCMIKDRWLTSDPATLNTERNGMIKQP